MTKTKKITPVAAALAKPVPDGLAPLIEKVQAAATAVYKARELHNDHVYSRPPDLEPLRRRAAQATARAEASRVIDGEVSVDLLEEIERASAELAEALARAENRPAISSALADEAEARREKLRVELAKLNDATSIWRSGIEVAADEQLQMAADLISQAYNAMGRISPGTGARNLPTFYGFTERDSIESKVEVQVPDEIMMAINAAYRGSSAL